MKKHDAILLIGPTGSGKTPLGEFLAENGFNGHRCIHFDFGVNLRRIAAAGFGDGLTQEDIAVVKHVIARRTLLEDSEFRIAETILRFFIAREARAANDLVILNGLPRHVGQAENVGSVVNMKRVISLDCSSKVVFERIRLNSGGDRAERSDDAMDDVTRKLEIFRKRTTPLLDYYRANGVEVHIVGVQADTNSAEIAALLRDGDNY
ncbi:MAG: nucleoside monophosphate kinase [Lentisphaerae bacterium]|nr:nucleoside monophosphate kinase [Lentisphaerota bacterium]